VTLVQHAIFSIRASIDHVLLRCSSAFNFAHPEPQRVQLYAAPRTLHVAAEDSAVTLAPFQRRCLMCLGGHMTFMLATLTSDSRRLRHGGPLQVAATLQPLFGSEIVTLAKVMIEFFASAAITGMCGRCK
jgi:hypothetical protein